MTRLNVAYVVGASLTFLWCVFVSVLLGLAPKFIGNVLCIDYCYTIAMCLLNLALHIHYFDLFSMILSV